jgi:pimeloyl-ACP methyl ester carboxylesterase
MPRMSQRFRTAAACLALVAAGLSVPSPAGAAPTSAGPPSAGASVVLPQAAAEASRQVAAAPLPTLTWKPCAGAPGRQCARAQVPLDYDAPLGARISLALAKLPAGDPAHRIGTLFVNPGGPGGSGVDLVKTFADQLFTPAVRARFDILGFDPRGVAASTPLQCFATTDQALAALAPFAFPYTRAQERVWFAADRRLAQACAGRAGAILDHMSTADVVRDIDLLRRAVGERTTTFVGYSYGSYIGSTYASLFPNRVRAVVIDGVIDPVSYATGRGDQAKTLPVDARLVSEQGAYQTLQGFLSLCD